MNTRTNRTCRGTTKAGKPCEAAAAANSLYCFLHDPAREEERREWSRKGGKASSTQKRLSRLIKDADELSIDDLGKLISGAMLLMLEGSLEPAQLNALASAAKALESIRTTSELQKRLDALEDTLSGPQRRYTG